MKTAILTLLFVFAGTVLLAQTKKKVAPKTDSTQRVSPQPVKTQSAPTPTQVFNLRLGVNEFNILLVVLQNTDQLDAKTANAFMTMLVKQVNDTTMNKPIVVQKQKGQ